MEDIASAAVPMFAGDFFDLSFWQSIASNLVATFVGAAVGVWVAFWFEHRQASKASVEESSREAKTTAEGKKQVINLLKGALEKNLGLLRQMKAEVPTKIIYYNVDVELLEATASLKYGAVDDLDFNRQIDIIRYELVHLHRKVNLLLEFFYLGRSSFADSSALLGALRGAICGHIPLIEGAISRALDWIEKTNRAGEEARIAIDEKVER
jgi:hypothetical protein